MLAMYSNEPIAKDFQKWIFVDILPSIRKYGEYKLQKECDQLKKDNEQFKKYLIETNNEYTQRIERIRESYNSVKKELHELQEKISNRDELILIKLYKKKISYYCSNASTRGSFFWYTYCIHVSLVSGKAVLYDDLRDFIFLV